MSKRFFTSDLHFASTVMVEAGLRPFKTVEKMNEALIRNINSRCKEEDILISLGDVCQFGNDRTWIGRKTNPREYISRINPTFVNIQGNHDPNNRVKSVCSSMRTMLGKRYLAVSLSHYPSFDKRAAGTFRRGDVHLCGHVHGAWKHKVDFENKVLNVNVGVDAWRYMPVSESELISYIDMVMRTKSPEKKL